MSSFSLRSYRLPFWAKAHHTKRRERGGLVEESGLRTEKAPLLFRLTFGVQRFHLEVIFVFNINEKIKQTYECASLVSTASANTDLPAGMALSRTTPVNSRIIGYSADGWLMSRQMSTLTLSRSDWIQGSKIAHYEPFVRHMSLLGRRTRGLVALRFLGLGRGASRS